MPSPHDLCDLQSIKAWIYGDSSNSKWPVTGDAMLSAYISAASRAVLSALQRSTLAVRTVNEIQSGIGGPRMMLKQYPLIGDLLSLTVEGKSVGKRPAIGSQQTARGVGWMCENPWDGFGPGQNPLIAYVGGCFARGVANVEVSYRAGYAVLNEPAVIPSTTPYTVQPLLPLGRFAGDVSVSYDDETPLVPVATSGAVAAGKYLPPQQPAVIIDMSWKPAYTFDASDAGKPVLLSYSFTPADLAFATAKWIGEWWKYKDRIGEQSRALPQGAGTASFDLSAMPKDVALIIQPYKRLVTV